MPLAKLLAQKTKKHLTETLDKLSRKGYDKSVKCSIKMKTHNLKLTTEQLIFVASDLIGAQLRDHSLIEHYCDTICETDEEVSEQKEWHIKMLRELQEAGAIHKCNAAIEQALQPFL